MQIDRVLSTTPSNVADAGGSDAQSSVQPFLELGPIRVDLQAFTVIHNFIPLALTRIEFDILVHLMRNAHRVVSHQELVSRVTGGVYSAESSLVRVHISRLRRKLGAHADLIGTVRARGFRFNAEASR
jgi:two-component system OmpR family response regulator